MRGGDEGGEDSGDASQDEDNGDGVDAAHELPLSLQAPAGGSGTVAAVGGTVEGADSSNCGSALVSALMSFMHTSGRARCRTNSTNEMEAAAGSYHPAAAPAVNTMTVASRMSATAPSGVTPFWTRRPTAMLAKHSTKED